MLIARAHFYFRFLCSERVTLIFQLVNSLWGAFESAYFLVVYDGLQRFMLNYSITFTDMFLKTEIKILIGKDSL